MSFPLVWRSECGGSTNKLVLHCLLFFSRRDGICYAKRSTIAKLCELHLKTVDRALLDLTERGLIIVEKQYTEGGRQNNARITVTVEGIDRTNETAWEYEEQFADHGGDPVPRKAGSLSRAKRDTVPAQSGTPIERGNLLEDIDKGNLGAGAHVESSVLSEAIEAYNRVAGECGWTKATGLTKTRKGKLEARLKQSEGLAGWVRALEAAARSRFLMGMVKPNQGHKQFRMSLDFLLQESSFQKILEGFYAPDLPPRPGAPGAAPEVDTLSISFIRTDRSLQRHMGYAWEQDAASWPSGIGKPPGRGECILDPDIEEEVLTKAGWGQSQRDFYFGRKDATLAVPPAQDDSDIL